MNGHDRIDPTNGLDKFARSNTRIRARCGSKAVIGSAPKSGHSRLMHLVSSAGSPYGADGGGLGDAGVGLAGSFQKTVRVMTVFPLAISGVTVILKPVWNIRTVASPKP